MDEAQAAKAIWEILSHHWVHPETGVDINNIHLADNTISFDFSDKRYVLEVKLGMQKEICYNCGATDPAIGVGDE